MSFLRWLIDGSLDGVAEPGTFDHVSLQHLREVEGFNFPPEIPAVGQTVKVSFYNDDTGSLIRIEALVVSREIVEDGFAIRIASLGFGERIGSQNFKLFKWDTVKQLWFYYSRYYDQWYPAIIELAAG